MNLYYLSGIAVMAIVTYLIRVIPMVLFQKKIHSIFIQSFLYYVPYSVLSAMTFPAIFTCTGNVYSSMAGTLTALFLASCKKVFLSVSIGAALAALLVQLLVSFAN